MVVKPHRMKPVCGMGTAAPTPPRLKTRGVRAF